ncbi:lyase family protein [Microbacterium pygmaeum]|uniref:3-carboxy-cis,cis-muconate cycloisomerase n=1 Tax=Microbacterium pygmaeum TaxID=370764 RepID=A0A1G7VE60_9MICO|nr:lyase family protein [Microbacterium pygmaeum]SDG58013.1 3-carboxy-cis,cis-muconate cycloisomerase [Microbacterium pygmaeum]
MPSDLGSPAPAAIDLGLLSPVTVGHDAAVSDGAVLDALVSAEVALVRAHGAIGTAPQSAVDAVSRALGWESESSGCRGHGIDPIALAAASVAGGNPVIPLVALVKQRVPSDVRAWVHRGATSQDILDTALMSVSRVAGAQATDALRRTERALVKFISANGTQTAAARTLTQHAVPTTVGLRASAWLRGVRRATERLDAAVRQLPAQLGGAGGTLASFVEIAGADAAARLPAAFADAVGLAAPDAPWQTTRWPVTELGDALVQAIDAVGVIATDVATLSRTEIGELAEGAGGGSSAMPQKQNPAASVLVRSAALRAPQLGATLHLAAALAVDERPDGAWHAEWPTLRELLRLALGATAHAATLVEGLRVDEAAVDRNLGLTGGLIVSERLSIVLMPLIGKPRFDALIAEASGGGDLATLVRSMPEAADLDVDALLDPVQYTGLADVLVASAIVEHPPATGAR